MPHTLSTERLILRPFTEADIDAACEVLEGHPDVYRFDPGFVRSREQRAARIQRFIEDNEEDGEGTLAVTLAESGQLIGYVGLQLYVLPWEPFATSEVELYYKLGRAFWGHGYASEACRAMLNHAFNEMRLMRVVTVTHPENAPSVRLLERLGFSIAPGPARWAPHVIAVLGNPSIGRAT